MSGWWSNHNWRETGESEDASIYFLKERWGSVGVPGISSGSVLGKKHEKCSYITQTCHGLSRGKTGEDGARSQMRTPFRPNKLLLSDVF